MPAPLILVVDDDANVAAAVSEALVGEGFSVKTAANAFQARGLLARAAPDLVVLDRKLPDADGLELCREIRSDPRRQALPVLFLTKKGSVTERVVGLSAGADDYLPKPFSAEELVARIHALLRRAQPAPARGLLRSGELALDVAARKVFLEGKPVPLSPTEFDLLHAFLESGGRVLSRAFLLERVWGQDRETKVETRVVDSTISHLRAKLGPAGKRLVSVLAHGYRLEDPA